MAYPPGCSKCKMPMESGSVGSISTGMSLIWQLEPAPEVNWWQKSKQRLQSRKTVTALRCSGCGSLELRAL